MPLGHGGIDYSATDSGSGSDDQTAAEVSVTPFSTIAATNVQAALEEIVAEATGYTDEQAQDAVGNILRSTTSIAHVYTDGTPLIESHVIGVASTAVAGFDESAQDAVGNILRSTTSVAFVYTDGTPLIEAHVIGLAVTGLTGLSDETVVGQVTGGSESALNPSSIAQSLTSITVTSYTFVLANRGQVVEMTSTAAKAVIIPTNSAVAFPIGTRIDVTMIGNGGLTVTTDSAAVTIFSARNSYTLATTYSLATIYKRGTDTWVLGGDLT